MNRNTTRGNYLYNEHVLRNYTDHDLAQYAQDSGDALVRELAERLLGRCTGTAQTYTGRPSMLKQRHVR